MEISGWQLQLRFSAGFVELSASRGAHLRLYYKEFAGAEPASVILMLYGEEKATISEVESVKQEPQFAAFIIGIDWADKKHVWCLRAVGSEKRERRAEHTPEAVEAWVGQLCQRFANRPIAVAVEQSRGALPLPKMSSGPNAFEINEIQD